MLLIRSRMLASMLSISKRANDICKNKILLEKSNKVDDGHIKIANKLMAVFHSYDLYVSNCLH
jgi:hypothetical protein